MGSQQIQTGDDHILETANGDRTVNQHIGIQLPEIRLQTSGLALDDCPSVLSVGQLVQKDGFRQIWDQELGYLLQDPQGQWYRVPVRGNIPELDFNDLEKIPPPALSALQHTPPPPPSTTEHHPRRRRACWCLDPNLGPP